MLIQKCQHKLAELHMKFNFDPLSMTPHKALRVNQCSHILESQSNCYYKMLWFLEWCDSILLTDSA